MAEIAVGGKTQLEVTHADKVKIELAKGQKGSYGWTVTTYAKSIADAIETLKATDFALKSEFGNGNGVPAE
jgi:hypothetical protein